jgi:hypothetical protein
MAQPALPRVLVAGTQEAIDFVQAAAGAEVSVVPAQSVEAAVQRLDASIALIVANIRFDDSRIFDFLAALHEGAYRSVPVVCFRMQHGSLPPAMEKAVELALAELGIAALVDLSAISEDKGVDTAMEVLRERLHRELAPFGGGASYDSCVGRGQTDNGQDGKR